MRVPVARCHWTRQISGAINLIPNAPRTHSNPLCCIRPECPSNQFWSTLPNIDKRAGRSHNLLIAKNIMLWTYFIFKMGWKQNSIKLIPECILFLLHLKVEVCSVLVVCLLHHSNREEKTHTHKNKNCIEVERNRLGVRISYLHNSYVIRIERANW